MRCAVAVAAIVLLFGAFVLEAASKKKDREAAAILTGTVFQSSGHSLAGAKVEAVAQGDAKVKSSTLSDAQGDFAIRVPAGRGTYIVTASAKGFQPAQKTVEVYEDEKVRTNLILSPQPKE
jgi:Carboxypeptidase regulatory-like domain